MRLLCKCTHFIPNQIHFKSNKSNIGATICAFANKSRFALTKNAWILKIIEIRMKFVYFGNLISNSFFARFFG